MAFAVVYFKNEKSFSEIPSHWIIRPDETQCYWPKTKNASAFMTKFTNPNFDTWEVCDIKLECYCDSLQKARKKASDESYVTTDSENIGRGKRKIYSTRDTEESDSESDERSTPPPKLIRQKEHCSVTNKLATNQIMEDTNEFEDVPVMNVTEFIDTYSNITNSEKSTDDILEVNPLDTNFLIFDNTIVNTPSTSSTPKASLCETDIASIKQMCSKILLYVKSIDVRLKKIEGKSEENLEMRQIIAAKLPIDSQNGLKDFESDLEIPEIKNAFIKFISNVGGRHPKDCVNRILKIVYSNGFGLSCSWLGLRQNTRACDMKSIHIIKDVVVTLNNITQKEFDTYASEWFRLSRARLNREKENNND